MVGDDFHVVWNRTSRNVSENRKQLPMKKHNRTMFTRVLIGVLGLACICSTAAAEIELAQSGSAKAVIILPDSASEREKTAAKDLKKYLGQVAGASFSIVANDKAPEGMSRIFVGYSPFVRELASDVKWDSLGTDDIVIRTVGKDLILSGGRPRGTVYAIYTFLQDTVGCRWWTRDAQRIPRRPSLTVPALNVRYRPPFEMRVIRGEIGSWPESKRWLRLTFDENFDPASHSVDQLLPKDHFVKHPDWFMYCKDDGNENDEHSYLYALKHMKEAGNEVVYEVAKRTRRLPLQPCLHSPGACQMITDGVLAKLESDYASWKYPPKIVWVTQCDSAGSICHCPDCEAVRKKEGSDSANWLLLVNDIAEKIEKKYPDVMVGMFAYLHTESPPKTLRPHKNVLIYSAPLMSNKLDSVSTYDRHAGWLRKWAMMAPRLYVWDYDANFTHFYQPHPNYFAMGESIKFFKKIGVDGVMVQSSWGMAADMQPMRTWVNAQMMWNPDEDQRKLMVEFLTGYYGAAGPLLMQYLDLLDAAAHRKKDFFLSCFSTSTKSWLTLEDVNAAMGLLDRAASAVKDNETLSKRVWLARRAIDFAWLDRYDELKTASQTAGTPFLVPDPSQVVDELAPYRHAWGPYRLWTGFEEYFDRLRKKFPKGDKPETSGSGLDGRGIVP